MASPHTSVLFRRTATTTKTKTAIPVTLRTAPSRRQPARHFTSTPRPCIHRTSGRWQAGGRERFGSRMGDALRNTKVQWYPIPVGLGIGFLGLVHFYKTQAREKERLEQEEAGAGGSSRPKKRPRARPDGPWYVTHTRTRALS